MSKILFFCYTCEGNKLNSDDAFFILLSKPLFIRGGNFDVGSDSGLLAFGTYSGVKYVAISFRVVKWTIFRKSLR